ncbi:MAG: hypothetical protein LBH84_06370 [Prevotellaceae bacterium]|nr:hypothetical protein [Prevotellaceae bacterium]
MEDTSLVRISTPQMRAEFLDKIMKDRLGLNPEEQAAIQAINLKYEELLQELTIANPATSFGAGKKKRGDSPFDKLSEAREKEVKKALSGRGYKEYDKQRWGMRTALKKQMIADKEERDRLEREQQAALKKAQADSIAAANAAAAAAAAESKKNSSKKKPAKKPAPKKRK